MSPLKLIGGVAVEKKTSRLKRLQRRFIVCGLTPIMLLFFVVSGMTLNIKLLATFGVIGVVYFIVRIGAKYIGAYLGCMAVKTSKSTRTYLGAALVPQAGVAIGLAYLSQRILPPDIGSLLMTIILSSSVLYELIGPACAKFALIKSGVISKEKLAENHH